MAIAADAQGRIVIDPAPLAAAIEIYLRSETVGHLEFESRVPSRTILAPIKLELEPWMSQHKHPFMRLAEATGVPNETIRRKWKSENATISSRLATRLLSVVREQKFEVH